MQPTIQTSIHSQQPTPSSVLQAQRDSWNKFSPGWQKWDDFTMQFLEPQGTAILDALAVQSGASVLDIATGTGDPGLTLASRMPEVQVTALDASAGMLKVADDKARALGLDNFRTLLGDACNLEFAPNSFDAVSCRLGFMFFPDVQVAADEMARVLKPGGVVATTVWAGPAHNSWITTLVGAIKKHLSLPTPPPGAPHMFRCAEADTLPNLLQSAGLEVESCELLSGHVQCGSVEEYWQFMNDVVAPVVAALASAPKSTVDAIKSDVYAALSTLEASPVKLGWGAHCIVARKPQG